MSTNVRNPLFARLYPRMNAWAEAHGAAEHRAELLAGVGGRVIEVGAGLGTNFHHYPSEVTEVVAVEPEPTLRRLAERAASRAEVPVTVVDGTAEEVSAADASFDVAVASLMLCSVRNPVTALAEIRRVLRTDGELRFYEHIRAHRPGFARYQRAVDVLWPHFHFTGGCHVSRPTDEMIPDAGFTIEHIRHFRFPETRVPNPTAPCVLGAARRTAER